MAATQGTDFSQIKVSDRLGAGAQAQSADGTFTAGNLPEYKVSANDGTVGDSGIAASNVALISKVQQEAYVYAADTGSANAYAVTLTPAPTIVAGSEVVFKAAHANTGASTLAVNGGSATVIKKWSSGSLVDLANGDFSAGQIVRVVNDGTYWQWVNGGRSLTLETDGTSNGSQTLLNLVAGSNVTVSDDGSGDVMISAAQQASLSGTPILSSAAGAGKCYFAGTGAIPSGWQASGFNDSSWSAPAAESLTPGFGISGAQWITAANGDQAANTISLFRHSFSFTRPANCTLLAYVDNYLLGVWLNGTQIYAGNANGPNTNISTLYSIAVPASAFASGTNVLAFEIQNALPVGSSANPLCIVYQLQQITTLLLETNGTPNGSQTLLNLKAGTGVTVTDDGTGDVTIAASGVTSVGLSMPSEFSVSGSPVTGSGTITVTKANESPNNVFAGPTSGAAAAPTFRSLVSADIPAISLTSGVSGILPVANGGSGSSSPSLIAGSNVTISGSWPNQTIAASGGGGGGGFNPWGSLAASLPPSQSTLTWVNQGTATATDQAYGLLLSAPSSSSVNHRVLVKTMPATPYTFTVLCLFSSAISGNLVAGICVRDSGSGRLIQFGNALQNATANITLANYNSPTSFSTVTKGTTWGQLTFFRLTDDGTNFNWYTSPDGINFALWLSASRTAWLASPNQIGITLDTENSNPATLSVLYWSGI